MSDSVPPNSNTLSFQLELIIVNSSCYAWLDKEGAAREYTLASFLAARGNHIEPELIFLSVS